MTNVAFSNFFYTSPDSRKDYNVLIQHTKWYAIMHDREITIHSTRHDKRTRKDDTQWFGCDLGERGTSSNYSKRIGWTARQRTICCKKLQQITPYNTSNKCNRWLYTVRFTNDLLPDSSTLQYFSRQYFNIPLANFCSPSYSGHGHSTSNDSGS